MSVQVEHIPVLLNEVLDFALSSSLKPLSVFDGTFGRGGHTRAFLQTFPDARVTAYDRDTAALLSAQEAFSQDLKMQRLVLKQKNFAEFAESSFFDFMLLDLGVSSPQLDQGPRGFSFYHDGPLDMRMDQNQVLTAEILLKTYPPLLLQKIFKEYGEIKNPARVVRAILQDRQQDPDKLSSTLAFAKMVERIEGWSKKGRHPATLYFMALRMAVNDELASIETALPKLFEQLNPGGRLAVISFHSLEDRIIKHYFKSLTEQKVAHQVHKRVIEASSDELTNNPRAKSAKLRVLEKSPPKEKINKYKR